MSRSRFQASDMQPDLLGGGGAPAQIHRLFFALMPEEGVSKQIESAAAGAMAAQPWSAQMIRPSRYHATLHFLGDHPMLREDIVKAAIAAADKVSMEPFEWVLDSASGFRGHQPPCVLRCSHEPEGLQALWAQLRKELLLAGLGQELTRQFTPHVTFAYSRGAVLEAMPIAPIRWRVQGFSLVHSIIRGDYQILRSWGPQALQS